ncbi:UNVERIFIED_CONTAM: hypothetical protein K2H54_049911 [Gekko kuhli]
MRPAANSFCSLAATTSGSSLEDLKLSESVATRGPPKGMWKPSVNPSKMYRAASREGSAAPATPSVPEDAFFFGAERDVPVPKGTGLPGTAVLTADGLVGPLGDDRGAPATGPERLVLRAGGFIPTHDDKKARIETLVPADLAFGGTRARASPIGVADCGHPCLRSSELLPNAYLSSYCVCPVYLTTSYLGEMLCKVLPLPRPCRIQASGTALDPLAPSASPVAAHTRPHHCAPVFYDALLTLGQAAPNPPPPRRWRPRS